MPPNLNPVEAPYTEANKSRNPHPDFPAVQASRPDYNVSSSTWTYTKTPNPNWNYGDGASNTSWQDQTFTSIDPNEEGRTSNLNYKLMISSTVPRPIALLSTISADGVRNLAPYSYFQAVSSDPPLYMISLVGEQAKDSVNNILSTKSACISLISDNFIEAANATSINTPPQISEWTLSGLNQRPSKLVSPPHVAESPFSIELKYYSHQDIISRNTGARSTTMMLLEAVMYHAWGSAVGADRATVDVSKLRAVYRAGGITYGSCVTGFEIPRPDAFRKVRESERVQQLLGERGEEGGKL